MKKLMIAVAALIAAVAVEAKDDVKKFDANMADSASAIALNAGEVWVDGKDLPIEGRWTLGACAHYYDRLPDTVTTNVNPGVRSMRHHTAGMQFRFKTDVDTFVIRYVAYDCSPLKHDGKTDILGYNGTINMSGVGRSGWDCYKFDSKLNKWRYAYASHPSSTTPGKPEERYRRLHIAKGTPICINLPLYNGIKEFSIGIASNATITALGPRKSGVTKPVVFYGTSITHGASASRPGMSFVNLIGRNLDVPVYNLGFSGCGLMEYELSEVIAKIDASCYVLDCLWNMVLESGQKHPSGYNKSVIDHYEPFIRNLRRLRPDVPIVMAEQCDVFCNPPTSKDKYIHALYDKLIAEGWQNLYYLPKTDMYTGDLEGTIEGCHPNDLGHVSMAKAFGKVIAKALKLK